MPPINASWHRGHLMPKNASPAERLEYHTDHAKHCSCRIPTAEFMEKPTHAAQKSGQKKAVATRKPTD